MSLNAIIMRDGTHDFDTAIGFNVFTCLPDAKNGHGLLVIEAGADLTADLNFVCKLHRLSGVVVTHVMVRFFVHVLALHFFMHVLTAHFFGHVSHHFHFVMGAMVVIAMILFPMIVLAMLKPLLSMVVVAVMLPFVGRFMHLIPLMPIDLWRGALTHKIMNAVSYTHLTLPTKA